jgi:hypothetical protein
MPIIKNKDELLSHGSRDGRRVVLDVLESAIRAMDRRELVKVGCHPTRLAESWFFGFRSIKHW